MGRINSGISGVEHRQRSGSTREFPESSESARPTLWRFLCAYRSLTPVFFLRAPLVLRRPAWAALPRTPAQRSACSGRTLPFEVASVDLSGYDTVS